MPSKRKAVIILGNRTKPRVAAAVRRALPLIRRHARVVAVDLDDSLPVHSLKADLVLVFGGDGAILKAVRRLANNIIPLCGINLGKLGFLASLTDRNLAASLRSLLLGRLSVASAMTLDCSVRRQGTLIHRSRAVNDAVVSRGALSRIVPIHLFLEGDRITTYNGDGLIVSTPLGSTAHSLSAGGPIVVPGLEAIILAPICPHTLSNRPLVLPANRRIELEIGEGPEGVALTVDGQVFQELRPRDRVAVTKSRRPFRLVQAAGHNYFRTLREKLGWGGYFAK